MLHKALQDFYHRTTTIQDTPTLMNKRVIVKQFTDQELIDSIVAYMTIPNDELVYPTKSYAVAIVYAHLLEQHFGVNFYDALNDPSLLYNNDDYFVPYSNAKIIYDSVLNRLPVLIDVTIPQIAATIEYFCKEFLVSVTDIPQHK